MNNEMTEEQFTERLEDFVLSCCVAPDVAAHVLAATGQKMIEEFDAGRVFPAE